MKPISVINVKAREGNLLEENRSGPTDVHTLTHLLQANFQG